MRLNDLLDTDHRPLTLNGTIAMILVHPHRNQMLQRVLRGWRLLAGQHVVSLVHIEDLKKFAALPKSPCRSADRFSIVNLLDRNILQAAFLHIRQKA